VFEAVAVVARFYDMAMMGEPVEQRCGHLRVTEDCGPFREAQIGRDHDTGAFVELAQQMKQQGAAGL